jgi:regulator of protease activity HflC (stomatin/prohibitin superfamily)
MTRRDASRMLAWLVAAGVAICSSWLIAAHAGANAAIRSWCILLACSHLVALAGALPAWLLTQGRIRADRLRQATTTLGESLAPASLDPEAQLRADAGWPQAIAVLMPTAVVLIGLSWVRPAQAASGPLLILAVLSLAQIFPLVLAEALITAITVEVLPEREALVRLLRVPGAVGVVFGISLLATSMGWNAAWYAQWAAYLLVGVIAAELALRALAQATLHPAHLRSCADSMVAGALLSRMDPITAMRQGLRERFGIDLAQSWSARILLRAAPWVVLGTAIFAWLLTSISLVPLGSREVLDGRGLTRVLGAGAHLHAPWPFATRRMLEDGRIHETLLGDLEAPLPPILAQQDPPALFDRLWDVTHPAESDFLVPAPSSSGSGGPGFRVISGDVRVQWRIGASDADAARAVSHWSDIDLAVTCAARRALTAACASRPLDGLMGADRAQLGAGLRLQVQDGLDQLCDGQSGIRVVAIIIDALHPPLGAAESYHQVQASEIFALTTVAQARGYAARTTSVAQGVATERRAFAESTRIELVAHANSQSIRFNRERLSWHEYHAALGTERYLEAITRGLTGKPLIVLDQHLDLTHLAHSELIPLSMPSEQQP